MLGILGICDSLRKGTYNAVLLRAYEEWLPPDTMVETKRIDGIPPYNEVVRQVGFPAPGSHLRDQIQAADAELIVTPEYTNSCTHTEHCALSVWG